MKIKSILAAAVLLMSATAASAQATKVAEDGTKYEFKGHTFLNLGVGAQYTLGEAKFGKLISPNVQIGLGYQFTPVFGARIQANAWQSKGGWNGFMPAGSTTAYTNDYKWNYVAPGIDFMFNLSNWWGGWNPKRVFSVTAFLGGGANIAFKNNEANDIAKTLQSVDAYNMPYIWDGTKVRFFGRGGLEGAFRLSDAVALTIEANANLLSDKYNSKKAEKKMKAARKAQKDAIPDTYVVQEGDTLYKIATRFYGRTSAWKQIREANKDTISTDGRVRTGMKIRLPK